jgi:diaminopimelate epimerase
MRKAKRATTVPFVKMHAAGNDYVLVDEQDVPRRVDRSAFANRISDRRTGVGGDGLILVGPSRVAAARMEMYNSDGTPSAMCGNGLRLVARFLERQRAMPRRFLLESGAGLHEVVMRGTGPGAGNISIAMGRPIADPGRIPVVAKPPARPESFVEIALRVGGRNYRATCLSMGNPHCVLFTKDVTAADVASIGSSIERDRHFPKRTNVSFVEVIDRRTLRTRTWERGAGETFSCGSGACASALAAAASGRTGRVVRVEQRGGTLEVEWKSSGIVHLTGPAVVAFSGEWRTA